MKNLDSRNKKDQNEREEEKSADINSDITKKNDEKEKIEEDLSWLS